MANKKSTQAKTKTKTTKKPAAKKPASRPAPAKKTVHSTEPYHPGFGVILLAICAVLLAILLPFLIRAIIVATNPAPEKPCDPAETSCVSPEKK